MDGIVFVLTECLTAWRSVELMKDREEAVGTDMCLNWFASLRSHDFLLLGQKSFGSDDPFSKRPGAQRWRCKRLWSFSRSGVY